MNLDKLLNASQKRDVIHARLWHEGAPLTSRVDVLYDVRYGWDFSVLKSDNRVVVTFSVRLDDRRFERVLKRCAQAIHDVVSGRRAEVYAGTEVFDA